MIISSVESAFIMEVPEAKLMRVRAGKTINCVDGGILKQIYMAKDNI